jgi:ADP-ribosyl-[dinitrogen reductase] hydrolase
MDMKDRFKGCLLGLAAGDSLGMPVEGYSAEEIASRFGPIRDMMAAPVGHFHYGLSAGQYTDDTEETLILAESIIEACGFSGDRFADRLMDWGSLWTLDRSLDRGVGFTTKSSIENMLSGISWKEAGLPVPTCGSAMRVAPIGLFYHQDLNLAARYAELSSIPTHTAPAARAGSVAIAAGVTLGLKGFSKRMILKTAATLSSRADPVFSQRLMNVESLLDTDPVTALSQIGCSPEVSDAVPAAFYCYLKFEPEEALVMAATSGGDTDSIASMTGALLGAYHGSSWIPERWLNCLEDRSRIEQVAIELADLSLKLCH